MSHPDNGFLLPWVLTLTWRVCFSFCYVYLRASGHRSSLFSFFLFFWGHSMGSRSPPSLLDEYDPPQFLHFWFPASLSHVPLPPAPPLWYSCLLVVAEVGVGTPPWRLYLLISRLRNQLSPLCPVSPRDKWVPVTMAWRVLRLRMEERPPIWRIVANILNKQSRTADEGWSSSLGVGRGANNASPWKKSVKKYSQGEMLPLETKQSGSKLLPHSDLGVGGECF